MNDMPVIFRHDEGSAESLRIRKVFALKRVAWKSCPLGPSDDNSSPLDLILSGAMGQPILQRGRSLWVAGLSVLDALETLFPNPTLFPNGNRGMPLALSWWGDNFSAATDADQILAHAHLIERQLTDGRDFLQGTEAGLADVQAFAGLHVRGALTTNLVSEWQERMAALGEGRRGDIASAEALAELAPGDGHSGSGKQVSITSLDSGVTIEGDEIACGPGELVIGVSGSIRVHFPAIGYTLTAA